MEEDLETTLTSLKHTHKPEGHVEILIIVNFSEADITENKNWSTNHFNYLLKWSKKNSEKNFQFIPVLLTDLPKKHAGAGLARKIGMDIALHRFDRINKPDGLIISLDADTLVEQNYFIAIEEAISFNNNPGGCIIKFEHILTGGAYPGEVYKAIVLYELYLRYYRNILCFIGFPFAFYTIGSCFGVRADVYARQGGMNRKKAGEDFYFLTKLFPHVNFVAVNNTCVHPSPRPSLRVPFGTGPVIHKLTNTKGTDLLTYHPQAFFDLKLLFSSVSSLYAADEGDIKRIFFSLSIPLQEFLTENSFKQKLEEIRKNTATLETFSKRFFLWFDGFQVIRYLNFVHKKYFKKIPVQQAANQFLISSNNLDLDADEHSLLAYFRELDLQ
jgi:hypothetical protein